MKYFVLLLLGLSICLHLHAASAEDSPQAVLGGGIQTAPLGTLPPGWKIMKGDWAVRLDQAFAAEGSERAMQQLPVDPALEKESLLPRVLGTDMESGKVEYVAKDFGDFELVYQMKYATERNYWSDAFEFRVQPKDKSYYAVQHDRNGTFSLLEYANGTKKTLVTSPGKLDVDENQWIWVHVKAQGNRFQVWACTDGLSFAPYIDYADAACTAFSGKMAFAGPNRFRFSFLENPWNNDLKKKREGTWLISVQQGYAYRQLSGSDRTQNQALVEYFVEDPAKAPTTLSLVCDGEKSSRSLGKPTIGYHQVSLYANVSNQGSSGKMDVTLANDNRVLDRATAAITNAYDPAKLATANPMPLTMPGTAPVTKGDYMALLDKIYARYGNTNRISWDNRPGENAALYRATGDQKYLDRIMEWVRIWINDRTTGKVEFPDFDFSSRPGFAEAATVALEKGNLTPQERTTFLAIVADVLASNHQEGGGVVNRVMGYALTIKPLLALVPDHPMRKQVMRFHDSVMADFMATQEVLENSSNYLPITTLYMVSWIDQNNLQYLYQEPKLKNYFESLLQMIDPSGGLPQFADYGGKDEYSYKLVATFEHLATVYKDGRFKWAAHQMARHLISNFNVENVTGADAEAFAYAYLYADDSIPEVRPTNGSVVLNRNVGVPSKLILRSGWQPNDFFAAIDLLSGCEHGDDEALALLSVYKDGGQSLIDKAGRDVANHSLPLIRESPDDLPYLQQPYEPGRWYLASFDLRLFGSWGTFSGGAGSPLGHQFLYGDGMIPYDFTYHPDREFAFALGLNGNGKARVYLDDVKLVQSGPTPEKHAKELLLEDFEGPAYRWIGNFQKSDEAHSGRSSGLFDVDFSEGSFTGKKFQMPLYVYDSDYDRIEFWYKFEPITGDISSWALTVGDKSGTPRNYSSILNENQPVKQKFFRDGPLATFAGFDLQDLSPFGGPQDRERDVLFVKNKVLWVRDRITPDPARPFAAGPIWQVGHLSSAKGANWIDTYIDNNLLLWFVPKPYAKLETIFNPQPKGYELGHKREYPAVLTQYATGKKGGKTLIFDTLLLPHKGSEAAAQCAGRIKVLHDQDDVTLLSLDGDLLLCNPSGHEVSVQGLDTDCAMLYITGLNTSSPSCEGQGGTKVTYQGKKLDLKI